MAHIIKETFLINNSISISNKINNIPLFFLYFNSIKHYKNLDEYYNVIPENYSINNESIPNITYKQVFSYSSDNTSFIFENNFSKSLYHTFLSVNLLLEHNICFIIYLNPFILYSGRPLLNNFSYSLDFKQLRFDNLKSYFSLQMLKNPYIPIDIFLICYLIHNDISIFDKTHFNLVIEYYCNNRNIININTIVNSIDCFVDVESNHIIKKLFQFKDTWSIFGLVSFFLYNYSKLLNTHKLINLFEEYIQQCPEERNKNIIKTINNILFTN